MIQHPSTNKIRLAVSLAFLLLLILVACSPSLTSTNAASSKYSTSNTWSVSLNGTILQIAYGSGTSFPQYAALDLNSSYFRMIYSSNAGWGTSVILLPVYWSQTSCPPPGLCQGASITANWQIVNPDLVLSISGTIGTLKVASSINLSPPAFNALNAHVTTTVTGHAKLDNRPGEAFKPVMLSSMHISSTQWDAQDAFIGTHIHTFPDNGWIISPPIVAKDFGLQGGTSSWKTNAPTIEVILDHTRQITGWVTQSTNTNDDNIGFWAATSKVLPSWSFNLTAEAGQNL